jgi:hypothetical protein
MPKPKFNIGETVWKIVNGKAEEVVIHAVGIMTIGSVMTDEDRYFVKYRTRNMTSSTVVMTDDETTLFSTKEELIGSL